MASKIATPYADALLDVAKSTSSIHTITSDVNNLRDLLASTKMLKNYLNNPLAGVKAKREIIEKIISPEVSLPMSNFLFLLADRKRINYLETIT